MTQHHCDHECVCPDYKASHSDWEEDPDPCTMSCYHRSHPHTPAPAALSPEKILCCAQCPCRQPDCEDDCKGWQMRNEHDAAIRNQMLAPYKKFFEDISHFTICARKDGYEYREIPEGYIQEMLESLRTPSPQAQQHERGDQR